MSPPAPASLKPESMESTSSASPPVVKQTLELLKPWIHYVPKEQRRLGFFLLLAFGLHLILFLSLRIDTTRPPARPHLPQTRVMVETSQQPAELGFSSADSQFWDQINDPRLYLFPRADLFGLHKNQTLEQPTDDPVGNLSSPLQAEPAQAQYQSQPFNNPALEVRALAALEPRRQPFTYRPPPLNLATTTVLQWDSDLLSRKPFANFTLPSPVSNTDLSPTELWIAVDNSGTVKFVLLDKSCSNPDLDQLAISAVRRTRFAASYNPTKTDDFLWGSLTIFWHDTGEPTEVVVPTPPSPDKP